MMPMFKNVYVKETTENKESRELDHWPLDIIEQEWVQDEGDAIEGIGEARRSVTVKALLIELYHFES